MNLNELKESIVGAADNIAKSRIDEYKRTVSYIESGTITSIIGDNKYGVTFSGKEYTAKSHFTHNLNDVVKFVVVNGNMKDLIIIY